MSEYDERLKAAKARVEAIRGFWVHFFTYVLVNLALLVIDWLSGPGWWFYWPLLGWGIGVASHAFSVYGAHGLFGQEWEKKQVRKYMEQGEPPPKGDA